MTDPETHNHHPQQQQQHAHVQRPTEAQLRWAQFRHKRAAVTVQEKIMQLWLQPASVREVPGARSDDGHSTSGSSSSSCSSNGNRQEEKLQPRRRARRKREKPKISRGRRALLRVSNRLYEQRHQQIEKDGFRCGDVDPDEEEEDALAAIFAEGSSFRKKRKRKLSSKQDEERIRRFESAFYAMMMSLAPKKHNDTPNIVSSRKWTRPPTMNGHFSSVDGNNQNSNGSHEWNWGRGGGVGVPKSASKNPTGVPDAFNFDHGASWLVHLPPKDKTFTHVMRQHLGDVAVTFLTDNNNNTTATTADQPNDEDVAATLVEHFERHVSVSEEKLDIVVVTPRDIASLVARLEQATTVVTTKRRGHEVSDHVGTVVTPTTADLVSRFENPTVDKEGFVQRFVAQMEQAAKVEQLVSADGKLHKPTFARLVKEYLGQKATTHPRKSSPLPSPILDRATVEPTDSSKSISGSAYPDKDDLKETKNLAVFVQNFILQVEQDDELEKIVTSKGALNRPVFEKRVNCYLAEATRQCRLDSSSNTADRGSRFENQVKDKVGFVQRFVAQMEKSVNLEKLVSADGKLHKPTFARLVKEYLGQASTKRREFTFVRQSSRQSPLQAQMVKLKKEAESDIRTLHDSDDPDDSNVSSFVRIFIQQMEQDDKVDTIVTSEGTLNMPVFEKLVNRYLAEATQRCLQLKEEGPVTNAAEGAEQKTLGSIRENDYPLPLLQDDIPTTTESMQHDRTPIRMTNFFGRIRSVGAKVNSFRFGRDEPSTAIGLSGGDGFVDRNLKPANQDSKSTNNDDNANACYFFLDVSATTTVNHNNATDDHNKTSHVAESVSNKVGELFKILNSKDIADETAAYSAFRQVQDKKRRGATDDASSQSSFRVLPAGIRKVVKGFRGGKSKLLSSHIQDDNESRSSDTDDDALLDDEDDFDDESDFSNGSHNDPVFSSADVKGLQATLLMNTYGLSSEQSIIDTDGSIISGNDMQSKKVESLMLSPTILTKRLQQAIRAVETRKWDQVKYLLSANPWLAEMADVNTNQYVLHKLAFYGAGQLGIDHTTGEVIAIRRPPAPEQINFDLVQLFPSSVHKLDRDGNLPLHMAAASGNYAMIKLLGDRFPSGASVRNEDGMLPLHLVIIACASPVASTYAAGVSATDIVRTVAGYFPGAIGVTDNDGNLPIHTAASALQGDIGASIIYFLLDEAERQVSGPSCLRFRNKCSMKDIETESFDTETTATPSDTSNHLDDDTNCLLVHNEMGHVPLLLSIYAHAGWEVIEALASCGPGGLQALDSDNNNALHLLVSDHCKDASAALAVLRVVPEAATARNENGMLPIEVSHFLRRLYPRTFAKCALRLNCISLPRLLACKCFLVKLFLHWYL